MKGPVSRFLDMAWVLLVAAPLLVAAEVAPAQTYAVTTKPNVEYVVHEGVKLTGDFYLPKGLDKAPVIVAVTCNAFGPPTAGFCPSARKPLMTPLYMSTKMCWWL